jgi:RHS repeat-associated protein
VYAGETRVLSKLVKTPNTLISNTTGTVPGSNGLNNGVGKKLGIIKRLPGTTSGGVNPPVEKDEFFYHGDHLGSSNMITDDAGAVYQHLEYFPYGESWIEEGGSHGGNLPGYKFTGKELDPETGLYYYGARYYDAVLSKWISADPAFEKFLPTGDKQKDKNLAGLGGIFNSRNVNLYNYCLNNPLVFKDPNGLDVFWFGVSSFTAAGGKPDKMGSGFIRQTEIGLAVDAKTWNPNTWTFQFYKSIGPIDTSSVNNQVRGATTGLGPVWGQLHGDFNTFYGKGRQHTVTGVISWSDITITSGAKGFEASVGGKGYGAAEIDIDTFSAPLFSTPTGNAGTQLPNDMSFSDIAIGAKLAPETLMTPRGSNLSEGE